MIRSESKLVYVIMNRETVAVPGRFPPAKNGGALYTQLMQTKIFSRYKISVNMSEMTVFVLIYSILLYKRNAGNI